MNELSNLTYRPIMDAVMRREPMTLWVYAKDVTGFDRLTEEWTQLPLPPMMDGADMVRAVFQAATPVDSCLTMVTAAVEQGVPAGVVKYRSGPNQTVEILISWPEEKQQNF